ncbi:hypothetical protein GCM10023093_02220 [Nemorincola caseinilytica]|uniref:Ig-like domain-containing protein n=1 Tax=Nemorincola caseinilytica TaxID=2054315 RepID=A0ABP8N5B1_9BACT
MIPSANGSFESGSTFAANGWTVVNSGVNDWYLGTVVSSSGNGAYISTNGTAYTYNVDAASVVHFYRDITIPNNITALNLSFLLRGRGEASYDRLIVYVANPECVTPVAGSPASDGVTAASGGTTLNGIAGVYVQATFTAAHGSAFNSYNVALPTNLAGRTIRLIFTWQNDNSFGQPIPAAIDNIALNATAGAAPTMTGSYTVGSGGNYANLGAAITALNSNGMNGAVNLELLSTYTGDASTVTIGNIRGASSSNILTIRPASGATVTMGGTSAPLISMNGARYVTIDGRQNSTGTTSSLTIQNTSTGTAIQFVNGAVNNTVKYSTIRGGNTSTTSGCILFASTNTVEGNNNNTIDNCTILGNAAGTAWNVNNIYSAGNTTITAVCYNNKNNTISNNRIADYFSSSAATNGINIASSSDGWTITGNRFYQTATRSYGTTNAHRAILVNNTSNTLPFTITNNIIGYSSGTGTGIYTMTGAAASSFAGITVNTSNTIPVSIQSNTVTAISLTSASASATGTFFGISVAGGSANVGTLGGNVIGAGTGTGAIVQSNAFSAAVTMVGIGSGAASPALVTISNNTIGGMNAVGSTTNISSGITGIQLTGSATLSVTGNIIGSNSTANSINASTASTSGTGSQVAGIFCNATGSNTITGNTIANLNQAATTTGAHIMFGILINGASANSVISGNNVHDLYSATANTTTTAGLTGITGISVSAAATTPTIANNTVNALVATNTAAVNTGVTGIGLSGATNGTISSNVIYDLRSQNTGTTATAPPYVAGILASNPTTAVTIINNMITLGNAQTSNTAFTGIMNNANSTATIKAYFNSIYISGTAASGALPTAGFQRGNYNTTAFTTPVDLRNNVFANYRTGGTGIHYTIGNNIGVATSNASGWGSTASNTNVFSSPIANHTYWTGAKAFSGATSWQTSSAGDANSVSYGGASLPISFVNAAAGNLRLNLVGTNEPLIIGNTTTGVTTDIDGTTRSTVKTVVGAHEAALPCGGTPTPGTMSASVTSGCGDFNSTFGVSGQSVTSGINYQWQYSPDNVAAYTDILGATTASYVATITATGYYRLKLICSNSGGSAGTSPILITRTPYPVITGDNTSCIGVSNTYTFTPTGGAWASSNGSIATVSGGVVTGVAAGAVNISYTASGCLTVKSITVDPIPASYSITPAISGVCAGGTPQLLSAPAIAATTTTVTAISATGDGGFETGTTLAENGWNVLTGPGSNNWTCGAAPTVFNGARCGYVSNNGSSWTYSIGSTSGPVIWKDIAIPAGTTSINLSFYYKTGGEDFSGNTNYDQLLVYHAPTSVTPVNNAPTSITNTTSGATLILATARQATPTWTLVTASIPVGAYVGSTLRLIFKWKNDGSGGDGVPPAVDNISLTYVVPLAGYRTWAPTTGLYTDAGMTAAYTGTATNSVYASPTSATTYTATASYTSGCLRKATTNVTINATVSTPINGTLKACISGTSSLSNSTGGGAWSSSAPGVASISGGGLVTGLTAGTTIISYSIAGLCPATAVFTVNGAPGPITGSASVCTGLTTTLANTGGIGTWTSSNTTMGTVDATSGVVTGLVAGTTAISYSNGCGAPVGAVITILQTPSITGPTVSCAGINMTLTGNAGGTWSSSTPAVGTINASTGVFTPIAAGSTTINYTLGNGCTIASRTQSVTNTPTAFSISPASVSMCSSGAAQQLTAGNSLVADTVTFGTRQNMNANTGYPAPLSMYYGAQRCQFLVLASELTAMGFVAGSSFTAINTPVAVLGGSYLLNNLRIRITTTAGSSLSGFVTTGFTVVRSASDYTPVVGDNIIPFTATYTWDGTSNLVFDFAFGNNLTGDVPTSAVQYNTNTSFNSCVVYREDGVNAATAANSTTISVGPNTNRPDFVLYGTVKVAPIWSATTGLYTNALATTAYTGTATNSVYTQPSATTIYTVTSTKNGCSSSSNVTVTVPVINTYTVTGGGSFCSGGAGVSIGLNGSDNGYSYALKNGSGTTVDTKIGTGSAITFANQTAAGTYTVVATSSSPLCNANMSGSATVAVDPLPTAVSGSGAGTFCSSTIISGSNGGSGTIYYQGTNATGTSTAVAATTANITTVGTNTYYFRARSAAGCWGNAGGVTVTINNCVDVSNFAIVAANTCRSTATTVTVNSTTLAAGTYTVTYSLSGANTVSGATASITMASNTSTFSIPAGQLSAAGATTVTVTSVMDITTFSAAPSSGNIATFTVFATPATVTASGAGTFCGSTSIGGSNGSDGTIFYQGTTSNGTSTGLGGSPQTVSSTGTYYFRARSSDGCWGTQGAVTVSINPIPTAAPTNNGPICLGGTATLTANGANGASTYSWTGPDGFAAATAVATASPTVTGVYSLSVTDGSGNPGCSPSTVYTTQVTVNAKPTATVSNNGPICAGGTVTLTATPAGGATVFSWTGPDSYTAATAVASASPTATATYSLTVTNGTTQPGCMPSDVYTTSVTVRAKPTAAPSNDGYICNGGTVNLTANGANGASTYSWTGSSITGSATSATTTATPSSTTIYTLTVGDGTTDNGCTPTTQYTTSVTVNDKPVAAPTNNGAICNGGTVTLDAVPSAGANTFSWSGPSLLSASGQQPTATPTVTSVYSVVVSDGTTRSGCAPTDVYTTSVTVKSKPIAAPTNNGYICNGGTAQLTANPSGGATVFAWSGSPVSSASDENPTANPTTTTTYSLTVSDGTTGNGCTPSDIYTTTVTVNAKPTAAPSQNGYICVGGTVTLTANGANGAATYAWTGADIADNTLAVATATPTVTGVYSVSVTDGSGKPGCSPTDIYTVSVTVNDKPIAVPVNDGPICQGGTVQLTAAPAGGANTFTWSGPSLSSSAAQDPTATPTATATYSLSVSDGSTQPGCTPSDVYTTSVTVRAKPSAAPSNDGHICIGGTAQLTANPSGGATVFAWSGSPISSASDENPTANPVATTTYSLTVSDGSGDDGCAPADIYTTTVTVNAIPTAAPSQNGYICVGGTVTLTANGADGAATYAWSGADLVTTTLAAVTATPTVTGVYSLTVTDGSGKSGCAPADIYTVSVTVNDKPIAAPVNDGPICAGGTVQLTAAPAGGANTFNWSGSSLSSSSAQDPTATPTTTAIYSLTVSDGSTQPGCAPSDVYTTSVTVKPKPVATPTNNGYICNGGTAQLTAAPSGGATVFAWSGSPISSASDENPTANPTTTTTYSLTVSDGSGDDGCAPADIYTTTVTVNDKPIAAPVNSGVLCNGGTVTLNAMPAGGANTYLWSGSALATTTAQNPTATPSTGTHVYSLMVSDGSGKPGCAPSDVYTTSVTVNPAPSLTSASNDGPVCEGITLNLSANGAADVTGYSWTGPVAITNAATASASVPSSTTAASGTYSVAVNNGTGSGCTVVYTTSATVNTVPSVASITPNTTDLCVGTTVTLNAGTAAGTGVLTSYNWSGPNGYNTTTSGSSASFLATTTAQSGNYSLTVTYPGTGCTSPAVQSASVAVHNLPTLVNMTATPSSLCVGGVLSFNANGAAGSGSLISYNWSGPAGYSSTTTTQAQVYTTTASSASGVYSATVTYTGTGCTSDPVSSTAVTVNALPTPYTITGGGFYCSGGTGVEIGLDGSDPGISYQLYNGSSAVLAPRTGTGSALNFGLVTAAGTYSIMATDMTTSCTNDMNDVTVVSVGPVPTTYSVTGGGGYCAGGIGVPVGLSNGDVGVGYQLYRDGSTVGGIVSLTTAGAFNFGTFTTPGNYTVIANPGATCSRTMNSSVNVSINPLPNAYTVGGGGHYCADGTGVHITLDFSVVGINYQLYRGATTVGSPVAGANSGADFGLQTVAGTYSVLATNTTTGCVNTMNGTPAVAIDALPAVFSVTGGGAYCTGGVGQSVGLSGSTSGVNYQLYNGSTATGSAVAGTGAAISFGTLTATGTYTVRATNTSTSCVNPMSGSATISINTLPVVYAMNGGGHYCTGGTGVHVGMVNSDLGVDYILYNGSTAVDTMPGASSGLDFGLLPAGTYTVRATNTATGCERNMSGSVTVIADPLPATHTVTGGGTICENGGGVYIYLDGSNTGISYQLYNGATAVGSAQAGSSLALTFGPYTAGGTYSVLATNTATTCTKAMAGSATIYVNPAPVAQTVTGGGGYCAGGSGQPVGLFSSQNGIQYQLYNGAATVGGVVIGDGNPISFGVFTASGTYSVLATDPSNMCTRAMSGSATITINSLPVAFNVTGGGTYCATGTGVNVGLSNSVVGINYQLYVGSATDGSPVAGTGTSLPFGLKTTTGTYTVLATNASTGCSSDMSGSATVATSPVPATHIVTGGGNYCSGGTGSVIGLDGSDVGINYRLYMGSTPVGSIVAGTGAAISMDPQTVPGTYSIIATDAGSSCTATMSGSATVGINSSPSAFAVNGGGHYCAGGSGVAVGLAGSTIGVNYQLYRGATAIGSLEPGTGTAISFGSQTVAGTYTVLATASNSCTAGMTGSSTVVVDPLPTAQTMTGGGNYCAGGTGRNVGLLFANSGVNYQLYNGAATVGSPFAGANASLDFGLQTAGTYSVLATDAVTGCTNAMSGTISVVADPLPVVQTVTGGGSFCSDAGGVSVGLSGSESGVNYQLYRGSTSTGMPVGGTGAAISFGNQTVTGTYTVFATNATTGCTRNMSGNVNVTSNPAPTVYSVTGGGTLCAGASGYNIGLSGSESNVAYSLYNGATYTGITLNGTGSALNFGTFTSAGTYTVSAMNTGTSCTKAMSGGANIIVNPLPTVYTVTGGGAFCNGATGVSVGLNGSQSGVNYNMYRGATLATTVGGTGSAISFGTQTVAGTYTVNAVNATTGCSSNMTGAAGVTVNALPAVQSVTGGGSFCIGGAGVAIGLGSSQSGVLYQLYSGSTTFGSAVAGTGSAISFGNVDVAGTYTVRATNYSTSCTNNMTGSATVVINDLPVTYAMTGGGSYCQGGSGVAVGLAGSQSGVNYQLYNGAATVGSVVSGTGSAISFGIQSAAGSYTVLATNASTGCTKTMTGTSTVTINSLPTVFNVTGGGTYCIGGNGVNIGISSTTIGVNYQLYNGATAVGSPLAGSGLTADMGLQTATGTYTILATNIFTGCTRAMNGSATIGTTPLPVTQAVTGGGSYCTGGAGVTVGLASSESGISYQLYRGATVTGTSVAGNGSALSFGTQGTAGTYTVLATNTTTGCTAAMSGAATVIVNALPVAQTVSGGGSYCSGGTGVVVGLNSSQSGVSYQLYNGSTATGTSVAGTGTAISFGNMTAAGTYSVRGTITTTGCASGMTGTAMVTVNALPTAYTMTGGGSYCAGGAGVAVGLGGSNTGVTYTLYRGATAVGNASGTGSAISFGLQTVAGSYSVSASNPTTGCSNNMSGAAIVSINAMPAAQVVTGGGSYCAGGTGLHVGLALTEAGVNYQLYRNGSAIGSAVAGTGGALDLGLQAIAGTYSVSAANAATGCAADMSGAVTISVNALPSVYNVSGGGSYCAGGNGVAIGLENSQSGVLYQLYNGSVTSGSPVAGTGSAISFGLKTAAGTYSVAAVNPTTGCAADMSGTTTININSLPGSFTVTGGGSYCAGGTGVNISLSGSGNSISYQLYNGATAVGTAVTGTGGVISFGTQTAAGTYSVLATNTGTGCTKAMNATATVNINSQPTVFTVTGGGAYCAGGNGVTIGASGSQVGVNYQLYFGSVASGGLVAGTGGALNFGLKTAAGTYSVAATNATTGCAANMNGSVVVSVNSLPVAQTVTGGGAYCSGGNGVTINMGGSQTGVDYQLYNGATSVGIAMPGTGTGMSFGLQTAAGTYSVLATNVGTGCTKAMTGTPAIVVNATPIAQAMTGGGSYCAGGNGVAVGISGSQTGVNYQLYNGAATVGTAVAGTGSSLSFGLKTAAGTYSVVASTSAGCATAMAGTSTISINAVPVAFAVTGGGNYCSGGAGSAVGLSGSQSGISYQLYNGTATVGTAVAGTGASIDFGTLAAAGTYSVRATDVNTSCATGMTGTVSVNVNTLPTVYTVSGGGSYCAGGTGVNISLSNSQTGISYQLYNGATASGTAVAGTGTAINFGSRTTAGSYTVKATNTLTGCIANMSGSATIVVNATPVAQTMTGGGNICIGDAGVAVGMAGSQTGVSYRLYNGAATVGGAVAGTGNAINFGTFATAGTYSVLATNTTTGCASAMNGTSVIVVNTLPVVQTVSGGGSYCAGSEGVYVTLSGSQPGVNYQLYRDGNMTGSAVAGTGSTLSFGRQTEAGAYTAVAMNAATGCSKNMTGSATVSITALPMAQTVTGGGAYCDGTAGAHVGLSGSQTGVSYQLYVGSVASGTAVAGTGSVLDLGARTTAGIYTVKATSTAGCTNTMSNSVAINVNALPAMHSVTGGGSYCNGGTGVVIGTDGSDIDVNYILYRGADAIATVAGTNSAISFGLQTGAGNYTVVAQNAATSCTRTMTGAASVTVDALPAAYAVASAAGSYCAGGAGVTVTLGGSQAGVTYLLYNGTAQVGSVTGTGTGSISFGAQTVAGTYTVKAINNTTGCMRDMTGSATISINPLPASYSVAGGGTLCEGGAGVAIGLTSSQAGINYILRQGSTTVATVPGTGSPVTFGSHSVSGTYNVVAVNTATGCTRTMSGTAIVVVNQLPAAYNVTGGGSYCTGGNGVQVGLSNSQLSVNYQLYKDGTAIGVPVAGNGSAISLGTHTGAGTYTVMAMNTLTSCARVMSGAATISINTLPDAVTVTGGGSFCAGGTGVTIGLANSASGVSYRLYRGATALASVTGVNGPLSFGTYSVAGVYSVSAVNTTTGCASAMSGTATVSVNALPVAQTMTGGGSYCAGGTGVAIGMASSQTGVAYQLYMGSTAIGAPVTGNGSAITFGEQVAEGSYSVMATSIASCTRAMSGTASISITPVSVPSVSLSGSAAGAVCAGSEVTYTATGVNGGTSAAYQWMVNGSPVGVGATAYTYAPANGDIVSVQLTSSAACAMPATASASMTMTVNANVTPSVSITADHSGEVCRGTSVTFTAAGMNGGDAPVYSWMRNGVLQSTGAVYTVAPNDGDVVSCTMTSNAVCRTANTAASNELTTNVVDPLNPVVQITTDATTIVEGQPVTFTAVLSGAGTSPEVQWLINGKEVSGATTLSFIANLLKDKDTVSCRVMTTDPCGDKFTFATLVVNMSSVSVAPVATVDMDVRILPNPNNGTFTIRGTLGTLATETVQAEVTNMLGQVVYHGSLKATRGAIDHQVILDNSLSNGMYLLRISAGDKSSVLHITISK